ncbi:MAG: RibD family protein, partial [Actinopolymorphaceae bacterium]
MLYEASRLPHWDLPSPLAAVYGGDLGFTEPCVYGNFVASIDGVVALGPEHPSSGSAISAGEPADRFVMGLLRACADTVLIGAGTLRATPGHRWTPDHVCPAAAADFADLRRSLCRAPEPELVVVTARGDLPLEHPALQAGALVATSSTGARRLAGRLPDACAIVVVAEGPGLRMAEVLTAISVHGRRHGRMTLLVEGGPRLFGQLIAGGLVDELFLTEAPVLAGRADVARPGLVSGVELLPHQAASAELISVRQHGSYLFLRYRLSA